MAESTVVALLIALIAAGSANVVGPLIKGWMDRKAGRSKVTEVQLTVEEAREKRLMDRIEKLEERIDAIQRDRDECKADLAEALGRIARLEGSTVADL